MVMMFGEFILNDDLFLKSFKKLELEVLYFLRSNMVVNDYFIRCVVLCLSFNLECVVF
jgi:hypothetical protein